MRVLADRNEIYPNLFVGSAPLALPDDFDVVVLSAAEYQPKFPKTKQIVVYVPLEDTAPTQTQKAWALRAALIVYDALQQKKKVLVTCHQGLNRSSWIAALALRMMGIRARTAVRLVREARGDLALSNEWFVQTLEAMR